MFIRAVLVALFCVPGSCALAADTVYQGDWKTTNRKLDGEMTCIVKEIGKEKWQGRFYGVWQGVDFDYTVPFTGPATKLAGVATIDGAQYQWKARIENDRFRANFGGDRYTGSFDLKRVAEPRAAEILKAARKPALKR